MSVKKMIPKTEKPTKTNVKGRVAPPAPAAKGKTPANAADGDGTTAKPRAKRATAG